MNSDTKNTIQTPKKKLVDKVKESAYDFDKKEFKKFQEFFSSVFSNINIDEVRKEAWRIK